ncbi:hypothetical protein BB2000_1771 [Proteus mirabilis BB2000]|nr:hypothetical protein BB2000_1771 [Proteus mirabilis BB2000]
MQWSIYTTSQILTKRKQMDTQSSKLMQKINW